VTPRPGSARQRALSLVRGRQRPPTPSPARSAHGIAVADFSLILQWPLILCPSHVPGQPLGEALAARLDATGADLRRAGWMQVDGLSMLREGGDTDQKAADDSYAEFAYFHDVMQRVLYPQTGHQGQGGPVTIWQHDGIERITFVLPAGDTPDSLTFALRRRTIHLYDLGVAVVTMELVHLPDAAAPLTLARVQRALDFIRRSYAPFFFDDGSAARCPIRVTLSPAPFGRAVRANETTHYVPDQASVMAGWQATRNSAHRDIPVFNHWRHLIAPLKLLADGGTWRDPSDERIPINSFIRLADAGSPLDTLGQVHDSDWIRIADAEDPTDDADPATRWPYNPEFARDAFKGAFYDRFRPDPNAPLTSSRHVITAEHYSLVGAGWFVENILPGHFRRHYTQMALIARLESTALLAVSSRLSDAVGRFKAQGPAQRGAARPQFEREVLEIQDQFLSFVHRFRFTGVSSQVQAREIFAIWRGALDLNRHFDEVKQELDAAIASVRARQQEREVTAATTLTRIATVGGSIGLVLAVLSVRGDLALLADMGADSAARWDDLVQAVLLTAGGVSLLWLAFSGGRVRPGLALVAAGLSLFGLLLLGVQGL